jgi:dTDP-4-amino-4,6-dideoxygalactose transaminase
MFGIRFHNFSLNDKKEIELFLFESGIDTRPMFYDINSHGYLSNIKNKSDNSVLLQSQCLILPSFPDLTNGQVMYICDKIKKFLKTKR